MANQELIWVDRELAARYNSISGPEEQSKVFDEYLIALQEESRKEFKANLATLEEDVAIYTGLMLQVRRAFEKAKNEQLAATYQIWEKVDNDLPSIREKTAEVVALLNPLKTELNTIQTLLQNINTYDIERFVDVATKFTALSLQNKEIFQFLVTNFSHPAKESTGKNN